jgi:hypothetical protein
VTSGAALLWRLYHDLDHSPLARSLGGSHDQPFSFAAISTRIGGEGDRMRRMVRGTLNARRASHAAPEDEHACVFTFFDDPGEGGTCSGELLRGQFCSLHAVEEFVTGELGLAENLGRQLASSLRAGENSTVDVELEDDVFARYFAVAG